MIRKIQLASNNVGYAPMPAEDEEVEQHLTILSDGRVWLSRYCFGVGFEHRLKSREIKSIGRERAEIILTVIEDCFADGYVPEFVTDIGEWVLKVTDEKGQVISARGPLCPDERIEALHISDMIREAMDDLSLFVFDGGVYDDSDEDEEIDYSQEYRNQTGRDLETGEIVVP